MNPITVRFSVHYATQPGEDIVVCGDAPMLGQWSPERAVKLSFRPGGWWDGEVTFPAAARPPAIAYKYALVCGGRVDWESGPNRELELEDTSQAGAEVVVAADLWRPRDPLSDSVFRTSAFADAIFRRTPLSDEWKGALPRRTAGAPAAGTIRLRFVLEEPRISPGDCIAVTGSVAELGAWKTTLPLTPAEYPAWEGEADVPAAAFPLRYKYVVLRRPEEGAVADAAAAVAPDTLWEFGENRALDRPALGGAVHRIVVTDRAFRFPSPQWRGAGVAVPVFSLRSDAGMGIGEFRDIEDFADWAASAGLRMLQLLPVNDTSTNLTWQDSYPYSAISVQALHPLYLHLPHVLAGPGEAPPAAAAAVAAKVRAATASLRTGPEERLDYDAVLRAKTALLEEAYAALGAEHRAREDYAAFLADSAEWLRPYALFRALRDKFGHADYTRWGPFARVSRARLDEIYAAASGAGSDEDAALARGARFYEWVQYHCDAQLARASRRANARGVILKGDLPIGVARLGVEAWFQPHLFNLDKQTGAPPDAFSTTGQNWSFPTYNWEAMARDGYRWWGQRLVHMSRYFQAYRIDHILGFFRIWEIPAHGVTGLLGRFNPAHGVHRDELLRCGIWDIDRLTEPHIRWWTLHHTFGDDWPEVAAAYLEEGDGGRFRLKDRVATEKGIEDAVEEDAAAIAASPKLAALGAERIRDGLLRLATNVCLLREPGTDLFHPRIELAKTPSFNDIEDPAAKSALAWLHDDYFHRRQEALWAAQALTKLPALQGASRMLVCGEDLGMVPDCVPGVMDALGICSLRVQRMPKDLEKEFGLCHEYPYLSVCTPSTHDTSTLRGWWEEDPASTQRFFNGVLHEAGQAPPFCEPWVAEAIVRQHLHAPSMWAVFPIQDLLACAPDLRRGDPHVERINVPANPKHYWCYRLHLTADQLKAADAFNAHLRTLLAQSARLHAYE